MKKTIVTALMMIGIFSITKAQTSNGFGPDMRWYAKVQAGSSHPIGEFNSFAKTGFNIGGAVDHFFSPYWGAGFDFVRQTNGVDVDLDPYNIPPSGSFYSVTTTESGSWNATHLGFGPVFRFSFSGDGFGPVHRGLSYVEIYTKPGISFIKAPISNTQLNYERTTGDLFDLQEHNKAGFSVSSGFRIHFPFGENHSFFINPQHVYTTVEMDYSYRDLQFAYANNDFNPGAAIFQDEMVPDQVNPHYFNLNLGVSFSLGKKANATRIRGGRGK